MDRLEITIKNTFLHLSMATGTTAAAKRSSSAPGSLRQAAGGASAWAPSGLCAEGSGASRWSEASTSWDSASELESVGSSPKHQRERGSPSAIAAAAAPAEVVGAPLPAPAAVRRPVGRRARASPGAGGLAADDGAAKALPASSRSAARAAAPAMPGAAVAAAAGGAATGADAGGAQAAPAPGDFAGQMAVVIAAVAAALGGLRYVKSAKSTQGARGWSIVAQIRAEDAGCREAALDGAREALLRAARGSSCVHVLGHKAQPFMSTPVGFAAHLGVVENESKTCWNMINQGFCRRGCACRWEHPAKQTMVNVMVQVERSK